MPFRVSKAEQGVVIMRNGHATEALTQTSPMGDNRTINRLFPALMMPIFCLGFYCIMTVLRVVKGDPATE